MFQTKSLTCMGATDTMEVRVNYLDGNQYAQVFSNGTHFADIYLIARKADAGKALKTFVMELGVPDKIRAYGLKKQKRAVTEFMNRHFCLLYNF